MQWHVKPLDCQGSPRYLFILFYLFGCSRSQLQHAGTSVESYKLSVAAWGIEPGPLALGAQSFNHWTTREVPSPTFFLAWLMFNINQGTTESERGCCEQSGLGSPRNTSICDHHFTDGLRVLLPFPALSLRGDHYFSSFIHGNGSSNLSGKRGKGLVPRSKWFKFNLSLSFQEE